MLNDLTDSLIALSPLAAVISSLGLSGFIGAGIKEWLMERREERQATKAFHRERALRLYDRRVATAEAAIPNLQIVNSALLGMFRAWKGEMEGRIRPELTASAISNAQERLSKLSEEGHRAICLLRFHFGTEVDQLLIESNRDALVVQEVLSEFMTVNDVVGQFFRDMETERQTNPERVAAIQNDLEELARTDTQLQIGRLAKIIDLVDKRQKRARSCSRENEWCTPSGINGVGLFRPLWSGPSVLCVIGVRSV